MVADPRIRASDDDRDRTASLLREHHAAGRLTPEEFNERLDKTFAAKTMGELDDLLSDLPAIDLYRLPDASLDRYRHPPGSSSLLPSSGAGGHPLVPAVGRRSHAWQAAWGSWITVSGVLVLIWTLSGFGYPWFAWIVGPWGLILLGRWLTGNHPSGGNSLGPGGQQGQLPGGQDRPGGE
jgi:hypothetical protein